MVGSRGFRLGNSRNCRCKLDRQWPAISQPIGKGLRQSIVVPKRPVTTAGESGEHVFATGQSVEIARALWSLSQAETSKCDRNDEQKTTYRRRYFIRSVLGALHFANFFVVLLRHLPADADADADAAVAGHFMNLPLASRQGAASAAAAARDECESGEEAPTAADQRPAKCSFERGHPSRRDLTAVTPGCHTEVAPGRGRSSSRRKGDICPLALRRAAPPRRPTDVNAQSLADRKITLPSA